MQRPSFALSVRRLLAALLLLAVFSTACSGSQEVSDVRDPGGQDDGTSTADDPANDDDTDEPAGSESGSGVSAVTVRASGGPIADTDTEIVIELAEGDGSDGPPEVDRETTVDGTSLDTADAAELLDRLPELIEDDGDRLEFNRPPETRPRPRPGTIVEQAFPPDAQGPPSEITEAGPLEILRFQPEGPVDLAPFISVTFNQPMVALGVLDDVEAAEVPISITPEMPGRWIWLGTRTVRFEYEPGAIDRIPAATNYVVEVPAGTESLAGGTLADGVRFEFSTPTATVRQVAPMHNSLSTNPLFFIGFDQRVDPQSILGVTELAVNGQGVPLRLATDEEVEEDGTVSHLASSALPERWVVVRPVDELPTDSSVEVRIGPDIPSLEGPETSPAVSNHAGRTYGPLRLDDARCGWSDDCRPGTPLNLQFSNPLAAEQFSAALVEVEPAIEGMRVGVSGNSITIQGLTRGQTTYEITVKGELADVFDQTLGDDVTASIRVGDALPAIFSPGRQLVTLDPIVADDRLSITTINNPQLLVRVYEVDPRTDWSIYLENNWRILREEFTPQWRVASEDIIQTDIERNEFGETAIDLADQLDRTGHVVVLVSPPQRDENDWRNQPVMVWVQRTTLGIDAFTDNQDAVVRVTDLTSGEALAGIDIELAGRDDAATGTTDGRGLARIEIGQDRRSLLASDGNQTALLGEFWANGWERNDSLRWFVLDDRGLYKPGETVSLKGWIRQSDADTPSDLSLPRAGGTVRWTAQDAFGNDIGSGEARLSSLGGFDLELELPDDITLGYAGIQLSTDAFPNVGNGSSWHQVQVQEFRRPDFEVSTEVESSEPHFAGDTLDLSTSAQYFAGGPLAGSQVDWQVTGQASSYRPPSWPDFSFGIWTPWWLNPVHFEGDDFGRGGFGHAGGISEFWNSTTDETGSHELAVTISTDGKPRPVTFTATATVVDVNRQPITGSASGLVHPADLYVGLRGARTFIKAGETLSLDVIATDLDGELATGRDVQVTSTRLEWRFEAGSWTEVPVLEEACEIVSADSVVTCDFNPSQGGRYRIAATIVDDAGRTNLTEITRWVAGGTRPQTRRVDLEQLTLIPDGESWQPGDTAEILVQSPFADAHGLAVITRAGIDRTVMFDFDDDGTAVLEVPIGDADIPGIGIQIEAVGTAPRSAAGVERPDLPARPAYAAGQLTLSVPPDSRELTIAVAPRDARLEPGADTEVDVAVTGPDGEPVEDAELLVVVVDEAVLSLTGYELRDPLSAFYPSSGSQAQAWRGRATVVLSDPSVDVDDASLDEATKSVEDSFEAEDMAMADGDMAMESMAAPAPALARGAAGGGAQAEQPPINLRTNFDALAVFEPEVTTDRDGRATIAVPLPDNLTRYRVMVVATAEATDAGTGESNITARLPVTVRPTPPRFANFGDRFEFPVIVQNATDDDLDVDVALRATNLSVDGRDGTTVTVPANDRVEVRFEVAADEAGTARYQVAASSGRFADAAEGSFPVYTPATAEAFATYGVVDSGSISQPFTRPTDVFPQFGGLEISTSSTAVSALTDAVLYLKDYRYESSDAFASRIIAIISLDDILEAFRSAELPSPDTLRAVMNNDIERLSNMQNNDGGFPYWQRGRESSPYNSIQAAHALVLARDENLDVPEQTLSNALWYLAHIEDHFPSWYHEKTKVALEAYALHVRFLAGDRDVQKATGVFERRSDDQLDVAAWLWPVLAGTEADNEIERLFNNRVTETPNAATFATNYQEQAWVLLHSDRRTDAIALDAFLRMRPDSDLVLKVLNGLLAARGRHGHWTNVQENSFVLLAGANYFEQFENVSPDFVARAWLGDTYAVEHEYLDYTTDQNVTLVPMSVFVGDEATETSDETDIVISRDGNEGRLYYRLGLRYAPTDFELEPRDQGFVVDRTYEAIDDPADVVQNDDGSWTVKAGARVRVRLTMVADSRRTHVALIDPMPAGFEAVNPALATSEPIPQAEPSEAARSGWWWYRWFDHQNLRDDRAEAFSTWLGAGSYEYTYVARATTPGTFVVPPTRAEQIYEPEVFGRTSNTTVEIVD